LDQGKLPHMKLYDLAGSPNTRRTRIFIAEKSADIEIVPIDMAKGEHSTPEFLAKNSLGKLPVLELDDGTCLSESVAICRYLETVYLDPPLFGTDPIERAQVDMWERRMEIDILIPVMQVFVNTHEM
jgi:glutathione S-transferase